MSVFRAFEIEAIKLLGTDTLGEDVVSAVILDATFVGFKHSGVGYFLTIRHPSLPIARHILSKPIVVGSIGQVCGSYLAFVERNELVLEYAGTTDVPSNIRDLHVQIQVAAGAR